MRKVYFKLETGAIGLESYCVKVLLFYVPYLRSNGVEPVAVISFKWSNETLGKLIKRKFDEMKIEWTEVFHNKLVSVYYNRIKMRNRLRVNPYNMTTDRQICGSRRYLDYVINRNYEYAEAPGNYFDFEEMNGTDTLLNFSADEHKLGMDQLQKMRVSGDFVCLHARDSAFYPGLNDSLRNVPFESFLSACGYLGKSDVFSLRMGSRQNAVSKEICGGHIVDYAGEHRTDFMDIWLMANCKFFIGTDSGFFLTSYLFNKPSATVNHSLFLLNVPFGANDIYLPHNLWDKARKRILTFREIADNDIGVDCWPQERLDKEGLECIKNTPEEISELVKEMDDVLDGRYRYTEEDNYLQQKFRSIFKVYHAPYHSPARIGKEFLKQNKELFL